MDWFGDRHQIRRHIRNQMRQRGLLEFCDEPDQEQDESKQQAEVMRQCPVWEASITPEELLKPGLIAAGIAATSTDHELQGIENTVISDSEFWSSSGSSSKDTDEGLLYALQSPACCVKVVAISVYRAHYQHGDPLYPPQAISFYVGPSPGQLYPASPVYPCQRNDNTQLFPLYSYAPLGGYLLVRLHGKLQKQWEDQHYYLAIRHVAAFGDALPSHQLPKLLSHSHNHGLIWHTSWSRAACMGVEEVDEQQQDNVVSGVTTQPASRHGAGKQQNKVVDPHAMCPSAVTRARVGRSSVSSHPLQDGDVGSSGQVSELNICSNVLQGPTAMELLPPITGRANAGSHSNTWKQFLSTLQESSMGLQMAGSTSQGTDQATHAHNRSRVQGQPAAAMKDQARQQVSDDQNCQSQQQPQCHPQEAVPNNTSASTAAWIPTSETQINSRPMQQRQETGLNSGKRPCMGLACSLHHRSPNTSPKHSKPGERQLRLSLFYAPERGCGSDWRCPVPDQQGCSTTSSPTSWHVYEYDVEFEA